MSLIIRSLAALAVWLWAVSLAVAIEPGDRQRIQQQYSRLEKQYKELRAAGNDLRHLNPLVNRIKIAKTREKWDVLPPLLQELDVQLADLVNARTRAPAVTDRLRVADESFSAMADEYQILKSLCSLSEFRWLLEYRGHDRLVSDSGAIGRNIKGFKDVAAQRDALWLMMRGICERSDRLIESSVRALEYAFKYQQPDGFFRNEHGASPRTAVGADAFFLQSFGHLYHMLAASEYRDRYLTRLDALRPELRRAMNWLQVEANVQELYRQDARATNRLGFDALAFLLNGAILGDPTLVTTGRGFLDRALNAQKPDGVFPEHGGYDSSYQAVTALTVSLAWLYTKDQHFKDLIFNALRLAMRWQKGRIDPSGRVIVEGNKRTGLGQEKLFGKPKDVNYPEVALALLIWSRLAQDQESAELGTKIVAYLMAVKRGG